MRWVTRILVGIVVVTGLIYLYYTEVTPVVIFGLRSDYARAIPYQQIPEGLTSLTAESGRAKRRVRAPRKDSRMSR